MSKSKQVIDFQKMKSIPAALSDEHQRRWSEEQFERKLSDPLRNYDRTRTHLCFEIVKGGLIQPIDKSVRLEEKVDAQIEGRVRGRVNSLSIRAVSFIIEGSRERMREIAFGDQQVNDYGTNNGLTLKPEFMQWALDMYHAVAEEMGGADNIVSCIAHLDELNPHLHFATVPITPDGRLSAKEIIGGKNMHDASKRLNALHNHFAKVNEKWGLERGDSVRETGAKHRSLSQYHHDLAVECKVMEDRVAESQSILDGIKAEITKADTRVAGLSKMVCNLTNRQESLSQELTSLQNQLNDADADKEKLQKEIATRQSELTKCEHDLNDKNSKLSVAKETLSSLQQEQQSVTFDLQQKNLQIESLQNQITELEIRKKSVDEGKATFFGIFNKGDLAKARKTISERDEEIECLKKQIAQLQSEKSKILNDAKEKIEELKNKHAAQIAGLNGRIQKVENERDELKKTVEQQKAKIAELDRIAHPERYRLSSGAELVHHFIPNRMNPSLHIWTKVGEEEYDAISYNVSYNDVKRYDDGELTLHELVNGAFEPLEQINEKQAELLCAVVMAASGGPAQAHVGTGGGGSSSRSGWNDKDKDKRRGVHH